MFPLEVPEQAQGVLGRPVPEQGVMPALVPAQVPVPDPPPGLPALDPAPPAPVPPEWGPFDLESNRETDKVESFADDKTATFKATRAGLLATCEILENLALFSGIRCN